MKTDELIDMLAANAGAVPAAATARRLGMAVVAGSLIAALAMLALAGVRPDIGHAWLLPMFWVKLAFPLLVAAAALHAVARLARPGLRIGRLPVLPAAVLAVLWVTSAFLLLNAAPEDRARMIFGHSWAICVVSVALLSLPAFVASLWAMKGLAPTRLALAGAASGLLAGGVGAAVYSFACTEMQPAFLATWYVLGMLIPAALGAVLGPRLLRW